MHAKKPRAATDPGVALLHAHPVADRDPPRSSLERRVTLICRIRRDAITAHMSRNLAGAVATLHSTKRPQHAVGVRSFDGTRGAAVVAVLEHHGDCWRIAHARQVADDGEPARASSEDAWVPHIATPAAPLP